MFKIKQGEDFVAEVVALDDDNKKVVLTTATKLRARLTVRSQVLMNYLDETIETPIVGYGHCEIDSLVNTQLNIFITREQSALFPVGDIFCNILLEFPDTLLTSKRVEYTYHIGSVEVGLMKDLVLV